MSTNGIVYLRARQAEPEELLEHYQARIVLDAGGSLKARWCNGRGEVVACNPLGVEEALVVTYPTEEEAIMFVAREVGEYRSEWVSNYARNLVIALAVILAWAIAWRAMELP